METLWKDECQGDGSPRWETTTGKAKKGVYEKCHLTRIEIDSGRGKEGKLVKEGKRGREGRYYS